MPAHREGLASAHPGNVSQRSNWCGARHCGKLYVDDFSFRILSTIFPPPATYFIITVLTRSSMSTGYSGIMDLTFAIIPWQILRALQIRPEEKLGIAVAMSMGFFAAISAFIKASALPEILSPDFSCEHNFFLCTHCRLLSTLIWPLANRGFYADTGVPLTLWGGAEIAVTIMAASLPMMRVLVQSVRNKHISRDMEADMPNGRPMETTTQASQSTAI